MTLPEAWKSWAGGPMHLETDILWGLKLFWWARIGKLLEFLAGATIVADIVGPERLRSFGQQLHGDFFAVKAREILGKSVRVYAKTVEFFLPWRHQGAKRSLSVVCTLSVLLGIYYLAGKFRYILSVQITFLNAFVSVFFWLVVFMPFAIMSVVLYALLLGWLFDVVVLKPIAWVLERPELDRLVKIVSLAMLLTGFHFDLLTS